MGRIKEVFKFGNKEAIDFKYVGLDMTQTEDGIEVDNNHYVAVLELPDLEFTKHLKNDEMMHPEGQTEFRSVIGKLTSLAHTSRPDMCLDVKKDLQTAVKKIPQSGVYLKPPVMVTLTYP